MRVKGLVALLTAVLSISLMPLVAHAADLPSFEFKSVSSNLIDPGDSVTWKIQVNLIPGWVKGLNLNLIDPSGQIRSLFAEVDKSYEIKEKKSVEVSLTLKTHDYDLAGKYKLQWAYMANVTEVMYYDPINGKEYAGKGVNTFAQNMNQFDFTIRDAGTGKQKTPQLIESIAFAKNQINPGSAAKLDLKTSGGGSLISANVLFTTPDGVISSYCDATQQGYSTACANLSSENGKYSFSIPIWTSEDSSAGTYRITQIYLSYRNGDTSGQVNDTANWGGTVTYSDVDSTNNGVKNLLLSQFPQSGLSFTLLDAGQGSPQAPIWTELAWKNKSAAAGSFATLIVTANGFNRYLGNISVPMLTTLGSKNDFVYTNQSGGPASPRQIKPEVGKTMLPATKSGTFEVDVYIPRSAKVGTYAIGQLQLMSTSCQLSNMKDIYIVNPGNNQNCQSWPNGSHTTFYMGNLSKDFGSSSVTAKQWSGYVNPFTVQIEVTAPAPLAAPNLEIVDTTPNSIEYRYLSSSELTCSATATSGELFDEKVMRDNYWIIKVLNLKADSVVTTKLACSDTAGTKAESSIESRTSKPIPPASPKLTLDSTTTTSATFSIGIRDGYKYSITTESGVAVIQNGKVEVTNLKPGVKTFIIATITDAYGQSTSTEPIYFAAALPEKPAKPVISLVKVTTSRVEFSYEKLPDFDYELSVSEGNVTDVKGKVSVNGLEPNTKISATLKVSDQYGQSSTSDDFFAKTAIPELPALPTLFLSKANSDSLTLKFTPRSGYKYSAKASIGVVSISDGVVLVSGLKPLQKIQISLAMSDQYGQMKASDTYSFTTVAAPKTETKSSITCIKGKASKVITAVKPTCPAGYTKK